MAKSHYRIEWTETEVEFVRQHYKDKTHQELSELLGRTANAVRGKCHKLGCVTVSPGLSDEHRNVIKAWYLERIGVKLDLGELAKTVGMTKPLVCKIAKSLGLVGVKRAWRKPPQNMFDTKEELRAHRSRVRLEWHKNNEHPKGMLGKTQTKEVRTIMAENLNNWHKTASEKEKLERSNKAIQTKIERYGTAAPTILSKNAYSRCKGGIREDIGIYVRSGWEANYARYLNFLVSQNKIRSWRYEPKAFRFPIQRGTMEYTPDFEVTENDGSIVYHEVKGWMDVKSKTKLKRFAKYYPNEKLVLITQVEYTEIKTKVGPFIPNWEKR